MSLSNYRSSNLVVLRYPVIYLQFMVGSNFYAFNDLLRTDELKVMCEMNITEMELNMRG